MSPRAVLTAALVVLVVIAGCNGPADAPSPPPETTGPSPTTTPPSSPGDTTEGGGATTQSATARSTTAAAGGTTGTAVGATTARDDRSRQVRIENGSLPVNATLVFRRVLDLLDAEADPPVVQINPPGYSGAAPPVDPFERRIGIARPEGASLNLSYRAGGSGDQVLLLFTNTTVDRVPAEDLEITLAHEFVHVVQNQRRAGGPLVDGDVDRDVVTALTEGGAVYVTDVYARRYGVTNADGRLPIAHRAEDYRTRPAWSLPITGEYYFGARYLDRRLDDPADLWAVYDDPPTTIEQVIHGPEVGPARPLRMRVDAPDWTVSRRGPQGELVVRAALRSELDRETAGAAATGWGNDTVIGFEAVDGNRTGFAWVTRWDDAGEAEEFAAAARQFADRRRRAVGGEFEVVRAGPETVVLLTGPTAFVRAASADADDGVVTVTVGAAG